MSRSDNTQRKFDTNFPSWLAVKLLAKEDEQSSSASRTTRKSLWKKEMEVSE
jgi:hypothetical protein